MNEQQGLDPMFQENGSQWMEGTSAEPLPAVTTAVLSGNNIVLPSGEASPVSEAEARPFTTLSSASSDSESGADAGAATGAAVDAARAAAGASAAMAGRASEAMARAMSFLFCMSRPVWAAGSWAGGASSITSSILAGF